MNKNEFYQFTFYSVGNPNFCIVSKELPSVVEDTLIFSGAYILDNSGNFFGGKDTHITVHPKSFNAYACQLIKLDM